MEEEKSTYKIDGGNNQIAPNATKMEQNFFGDQFVPESLRTNQKSLPLVVLGAGADASLGLPTSASLMPRIVEYLETEEGKEVDTTLRKAIGNVRFHFDKFVNNAIDRLAKDLDKELSHICRSITDELNNNESLTEEHRKLGNLICRIFRKILDLKSGAAIDAETEELIEEVLGTKVKDDSIIDFSHINYTDTFKEIIVQLLQRSIYEAENPILRHVYRNILDIEQLLSGHFYGFYTGQIGYIRDYLYISWILWAYLVHEEQVASEVPLLEGQSNLYAQLKGKECQIVTFNYTTFAHQSLETALYFHGSLTEYVDVENKNEFHLDDLLHIDLVSFFKDQLASEISFAPERKSIPIPSFLPPLKLQTVISKNYIDVWYQTKQAILNADKIVVLGCSFTAPDSFFCDILRENRDAKIVVIDKNIEAVASNVCRILQLPSNRYSKQLVDGHERRTYNNRVTFVQADLTEVDLTQVGSLL